MSVEIIAAVATIWALATCAYTFESLARFVLLIVLYVVFEEGVRQESKMRTRLSKVSAQDMTSVWVIAGILVLPVGLAALLVILLRIHKWVRQHRSEGAQAYRKVFTAANATLAAIVAGTFVPAVASRLAGVPNGLSDAVTVLVVLVVFTIVNHLLVVAGVMAISSGKVDGLLGSWEDNLLEFATLCLGGLLAVAVLNEPWLAPLVLLPMVLLQRGALVRELETVASTDSKTGLLNAAAWEQLAERELSRSARDNKPAAVLLIDLDHFKAVNDTFGHMAGDTVLRAIGRCLTAELRDYDTVGRFGGEEFVALLPTVDAEGAAIIAERIRARIQTLQMSVLAPEHVNEVDSQLSASIGVACYPSNGSELPDLLHAADDALYVAKRGGRNRVEFAALTS